MPDSLVWLNDAMAVALAYATWFFGATDSVPRWLWVGGYVLALLQTKQAKAGGRRMYSTVRKMKGRLVKR